MALNASNRLLQIFEKSYSNSRDHKGVGMVHEKTSPKKTASLFLDDNEAVLVR